MPNSPGGNLIILLPKPSYWDVTISTRVLLHIYQLIVMEGFTRLVFAHDKDLRCDHGIAGEEIDSKTGVIHRIYDDGVHAAVENI